MELNKAWQTVADTDAGLQVLRELAQQCGFDAPSLVLSKVDDEINIKATIYNEARRGVYLNIRSYLTPEQLVRIEIEPWAKMQPQLQTQEQQEQEQQEQEQQEPETAELTETLEPRKRRVKPEPEMLHRRLTRQGN